jgi:hypothetical protein
MKRIQVFEHKAALEAAKNCVGMKFRYAYSRNMKMIQEEIESFQDALKPTEKFQEFEKKANELKISHAEKINGTTQPRIENANYVMVDLDAFMKEFNDLREEYKEDISAREEQTKNYQNFLQEEIEIEYYKILDSEVPETITAGQFDALSFMIAEDIKNMNS